MPHITIRASARLYYERCGSGPPLCHIHGGALGRRQFALLSPLLAKHHSVIDFDLRGVGDSRYTVMPPSLDHWVDDVVVLLDALGIERAHVHGSSAGGLVALIFASTYPERVDRLIVSCTPIRPDPADRLRRAIRDIVVSTGDKEALVTWFAFMFFSRSYLDSGKAHEGLTLLSEMVDVTIEAANRPAGTPGPPTDLDLSHLLPRIQAPTLVLAGRHDITVPLEVGPSGLGPRELADRLPHATLRLLDTGHLPMIEQPNLMADLIQEWLAAPVLNSSAGDSL